jgi:hypothetical protein
LSSTLILAQSDSIPKSKIIYNQFDWMDLGNMQPSSVGARAFDNRYEGVKGTPFWRDNFAAARIELKTGKSNELSVIPEAEVMLNLEDYALIVRVPNQEDQQISFRCDQVASITFADDPLPFQAFSAQDIFPETTDCGFVQVLSSGEVTLLKVSTKLFEKANYQGAYSADKRYDEFRLDTRYWIATSKGGDFEKIRLAKRPIMKALPDYEDQIKKLIKENNLDLSSEKDLMELLGAL